jgi:hypothetical protein
MCMRLQISVRLKWLLTHHRHTDALHCVCVHVFSQEYEEWMICLYYTLYETLDTPSVHVLMFLQIILHTALFHRYIDAPMHALMASQFSLHDKMICYTHNTYMGTQHIAALRLHVLTKWFITNITGTSTFTIMFALMFPHITSVIEWFITHTADIWTTSTVYDLMSLQTTTPIEWLIAHVTCIWMCTTVYTLMIF